MVRRVKFTAQSSGVCLCVVCVCTCAMCVRDRDRERGREKERKRERERERQNDGEREGEERETRKMKKKWGREGEGKEDRNTGEPDQSCRCPPELSLDHLMPGSLPQGGLIWAVRVGRGGVPACSVNPWLPLRVCYLCVPLGQHSDLQQASHIPGPVRTAP